MQRASRLLGKLKVGDDEKLVQAAWPIAVGKRIASRTGAVSLFGTKMVVNVEDSVWQSQLWTMRHHILDRVEQALGRRVATEIQFRVVPPRPGAKREESSAAGTMFDEADAIRNPLLRNLYRASRRRAASE